MTYPDLWNDFSFVRSRKRRRSAYGDVPQFNDLTSQYPILLSLAENLSILDLVNLGLASKTTWTHLSASKRPLRLRGGVAKTALKCEGLHIQPRPQSPHQGTPYVLPCASSQMVPVRRCEGCGVAVCEVCRFNPTRGAMLTYTHKRRWFFPSRSSSRPDTVTSNIETMLDSMVRRGRIARRNSNAAVLTTEQLFTHLNQLSDNSCTCTVESRWLDPWLCVPCLNHDIFRAPTHEAYYAQRRRSSLAMACQQGNDIGPMSSLLGSDAAAARDLSRRLRSMEQCSLCHKRLSRRDPAARSGRCLPPLEESRRRDQLHSAAKRLQCQRNPSVVVLRTPAKSGRRGSWPKRRDLKSCGQEAVPQKSMGDMARRRASEFAVFDD
ncbi:hypothetical protein WHR41_04065 [Cladosporium halotolerans]|uniref:Uncharacterized protein n=1 Tax=Cladosporium halotolerans TaxID=1052096 RepID=A0AB34KP57_9PEZI